MGSRRYLTLGAALVGLLLLAYLLYGPSDENQAPTTDRDGPAASVDTGGMRHQVQDFELTLTVSRDEVWHLRAPRADREPGKVTLDAPQVVLERGGETTAVLSGNEGEYRFDGRYLEVRGDVVVRRVQYDQVLRTNFLSWSLADGILKTHADVRLEVPGGVLTARGLRANFSRERLQFLSEVQYLSRSSSG